MKQGDIVWVEDYHEKIVGFYEVSSTNDIFTSVVYDYDEDWADPLGYATVKTTSCRLVVTFEDRKDNIYEGELNE